MKKFAVHYLIISFLVLISVSCYEEAEEILITDLCDDDPMINIDFVSQYSGSFNLYYLPGTPAERDREVILSKRNYALEVISTALKIKETRIIDIYMSPNRLAAEAHNVKSGVAFPWKGRIEVLYLDDPQTYERSRFGHEVTHVLAYNLDPHHLYHLKLIDEGLAEIFDQSGRNYHQAFVQECMAYKSELASEILLNKDDIYVYSYPKAASFIQNLFDIDPDPNRFKAFYSGCYMYWDGNRPYAPDLKPLDAKKLVEVINSKLIEHYGFNLEQFNKWWLESLTPYLEDEPLRPSQDDIDEIKKLFSVRDKALSAGDAKLYRSTMEGFYCDKWADSERMARAKRMTSNPTPVQSRVIEVFNMGIKNYPTAMVYFEKDVKGEKEYLNAWVEHYPVGWRFNFVEDEYGTLLLAPHSWIVNILLENSVMFYDSNILSLLLEQIEEIGLHEEADLIKYIAICLETNQSFWPLRLLQ